MNSFHGSFLDTQILYHIFVLGVFILGIGLPLDKLLKFVLEFVLLHLNVPGLPLQLAIDDSFNEKPLSVESGFADSWFGQHQKHFKLMLLQHSFCHFL